MAFQQPRRTRLKARRGTEGMLVFAAVLSRCAAGLGLSNTSPTKQSFAAVGRIDGAQHFKSPPPLGRPLSSSSMGGGGGGGGISGSTVCRPRLNFSDPSPARPQRRSGSGFRG